MIGSHRIRTGSRWTGSPSSVDSSTLSAVTTATSSSSRMTTSRVWDRIAGISDARNISPRPRPTTTLPPVGRGAGDDADGVGAPELAERLLHRVIESTELLQVMLDQVGQDFGVGLRAKRVALGGEPLLDLEIVFEDPVVHDDEATRAVRVGVGVFLGGPPVRRPPRVADADGAGDGTVTQGGLEGLEAAGSAPDLQLPFTAEDGHARGVVSPVFEPLEPLEDDPDRALVTDVPDDPAHR